MILASLSLLAAITRPGYMDVDVVVFCHHPFPSTAQTRPQEAALWRDKTALLNALRDAGIGYMFAGGLGSGYKLSIRLTDVVRWREIVQRFHEKRSLAYYKEWRSDTRGYGLLPLPIFPTP